MDQTLAQKAEEISLDRLDKSNSSLIDSGLDADTLLATLD